MTEQWFTAMHPVQDRAREAARRHALASGAVVDASVVRRGETERHIWSARMDDERGVDAVLAGLGADGWLTVTDVAWPGRPLGLLDRVLVGPGGVVVLEVHRPVPAPRRAFRRTGRPRTPDARERAAAAAGAISAVLAPAHRTAVRALVCRTEHLTDAAVPRDDAADATGTPLVHRAQLADHLLALPHRLTAAEVDGLAALLATHQGPQVHDVVTTAAFAPPGPWQRWRLARRRARTEHLAWRQERRGPLPAVLGVAGALTAAAALVAPLAGLAG